jgi:hypothetical protein
MSQASWCRIGGDWGQHVRHVRMMLGKGNQSERDRVAEVDDDIIVVTCSVIL